jgi:hypothetical protein
MSAPTEVDVPLILNALRGEAAYLNNSGRALYDHHENHLSFAIAQAYRQRFPAIDHPSAFSIVEGFYRDARKPVSGRHTARRADVHAYWPGNERFVEVKWGWGSSGQRSGLKDGLWSSVRDLGKLLDLTRPEDGTHPGGRRVYVLVAASKDEDVREKIGKQWHNLPDQETLETQLINCYTGKRSALLPGDLDPGTFSDTWDAFRYLQSLIRTLSNYGQGRCDVGCFEDRAPAKERYNYAVVVGRF